MFVGVGRVVCTCGKNMEGTGAVFGCELTQITYYCSSCKKHIIVVTPGIKAQEEFAQRVEDSERG